MEEEDGLFGLDDTTVSLICGLSVLFVVLIIITLGIIGFFIKVRFIHCQVDIDKLMAKIKEGSTFVPDFYPTPGIALFVGWSVTKFAACLLSLTRPMMNIRSLRCYLNHYIHGLSARRARRTKSTRSWGPEGP